MWDGDGNIPPLPVALHPIETRPHIFSWAQGLQDSASSEIRGGYVTSFRQWHLRRRGKGQFLESYLKDSGWVPLTLFLCPFQLPTAGNTAVMAGTSASIRRPSEWRTGVREPPAGLWGLQRAQSPPSPRFLCWSLNTSISEYNCIKLKWHHMSGS